MNEGIEDDSSRRKFIRVATLSASAACGIFPIAAGVPALLDPVKKVLQVQERCHGQGCTIGIVA